MKNIVYMAVLVILMIVLIPLIVLQGVGKGMREKSIDMENSNKFNTDAVEGSSIGSVVFDEDNGGGPKVNVYIKEEDRLEEMYLEEYLRGVVAGEMPAEFELEALKSQAIAARTYTVTRMKSFGGSGCLNHPKADICTDSTHCQEWISKEERFANWSPLNAEKYWDKISRAVYETRGYIINYESVPIMYPMYFSTSSGKTENSQDVFSSAQPYLRSVLSPNEEVAPKFSSVVEFTPEELVKLFKESEHNIALDKSKLSEQIKIIDRTEGGSVKTIKVGSKTLEGTEVRRILGLNSANFQIEFSKGRVIFRVLGYGHGVGMSQWGANVMAKEGKNFEEILKHYYQGTEIQKIEDIYQIK